MCIAQKHMGRDESFSSSFLEQGNTAPQQQQAVFGSVGGEGIEPNKTHSCLLLLLQVSNPFKSPLIPKSPRLTGKEEGLLRHIREANPKMAATAMFASTPTKETAPDISFTSNEASNSGLESPSLEEKLSTMDRLLIKGKTIPFTTVMEVYEICWKDEKFYEKWLASRGNTEITVGTWEQNTDPIRYNGELYDQKRAVTFRSPRTLESVTSPAKDPTHGGSVLVSVEENQYCRMEEGQLIVATEVKQSSIPFGEAFSVHWRWVATDIKPKKVLVRVGLSVDFFLDVLVADKLRQHQGDFSQQRHLDFFRSMKQEVADRQLPLTLKDPWHGVVTVLRLFFPFFAAEKGATTVPRMLAKVLEQLRLIELFPVPAEKPPTVKANFNKLQSAHESIKALYEKEKEWVINTIPDEEDKETSVYAASTTRTDDLPPFLVPIAKAVGKLHVIDPFNKRSLKTVLSETDNTVILLPYTDSTLEKMQLLVSKTVFHCTNEDVMKLMMTSDKDWYGSWLAKSGRSAVQLSEWKQEQTKDAFSGEMFPHSRTLTCAFDKSIYNSDPSASGVLATQKQVQCCRYDPENSAFVWTMTTHVEGMAYADCWKTHIRWVISQVEEDAVQVKIGYSFEEVKPCMMSSQIETAALKEAKERQIHLLSTFRTSLLSDIDSRHRKHPALEAVESSVTGAVDQVRRWVRLYPDHMLRDDPEWDPIFKDFRKKLKLIEHTLRHTGKQVARDVVQEEARHIFLELEQICATLEEIVAAMGDAGESVHTLDEANRFTPEKTKDQP